ncbi:MAG: type III-A CRISPR-associated RAMP protein Csm5 [Acidobacteria bacterium]|nr:type III-A CRISPR-associated RAMP protein Csm5 [Acidobacteriota bacterium]
MSKQPTEQRRYENYNYKLTAMAPVHIGTGEEMLPMEYHIDVQGQPDKQTKRIIVPDLEGLFFADPTLAPDFVKNLSTNPDDLGRTFGKLTGNHKIMLGPNTWNYATCPTNKKGPYLQSFQHLEQELKNKNGKIRLATKTSDYEVYIPGSSIKGALRTAWLYQQCLNDENLLQKIAREEKDKFADRVLNENTLQAGTNPKERQDKAFDLFRVLQVGDSQSQVAEKVLGLVAEKILNARVLLKDKGKTVTAEFKPSWTFYEAIRNDSEFSGKLTLDVGLLTNSRAVDKMGWNKQQRNFSLASLCQAVNQFAKDIVEWEIDYFSHIEQKAEHCEVDKLIAFYQELQKEISQSPANTIYLSIGHSSGWHKLTVGTLLAKKLSTQEFTNLRRNFKLDKDHLDFQYPKTRKLPMVEKYRATRPFGWVKIEFEKV